MDGAGITGLRRPHGWWAVLLLIAALSASLESQAFSPAEAKLFGTFVSRSSKYFSEALRDDEIVKLARLAQKTGGTKAVRQQLGAMKMAPEVLEDTYLRIAVQQGTIPRREAEGMFMNLRGTPGFSSTLSKLVGASDVKTAGHLNELRIADAGAQSGFTVSSIGHRFDDGVKAAETDIDVLLERKGRLFAIEAKDYAPTTPIPMDSFRADMVSLTQFSASQPHGRVVPIFSVTNRPVDANAWRMLQLETRRRAIELIEGPPDSQVQQIKILADIYDATPH